MTWSRFKALRSRIAAANKRSGAVESAPAPQPLGRDEFMRLIKTTGGKVPGVAQR